MASSATQSTRQMASAALSAFLRDRHTEVPTSDASRALRRKQQRERRKRAKSHRHHADIAAASDDEGANASASNSKSSTGPSGSNKHLARKVKKVSITKEEREIRQRILKMRENQRKGIPIIPHKKSADTDTSDDEF
ncbi:hypothetical protein Dda_5937 [Drechslerella dactyloides]|uniref:Uncharacterized protein n=1 Tax=Drechslerella dactyloides TaxID=74499 RepID=A0AAD6IV81_DREDA|nr:hypothetical protein Dda_5937 [Drechslerella dactyloides]